MDDSAESSSAAMPQLELSQLASNPPQQQPIDSGAESPITECFLCCDGARPGDPLLTGVCSCRRTAMHLSCQRRMLETARQDDENPSLMITRCGVCHATYSNADTTGSFRLSWLGALWCTCCAGVGVMLWSGYTVLEKGSSRDPKVDYWSRAWWSFELSNLTWCARTPTAASSLVHTARAHARTARERETHTRRNRLPHLPMHARAHARNVLR